MWTEAELPDWDLESVYGREALWARTMAQIVQLEKKYAEQARTPLATLAAFITPEKSSHKGLEG